MPDQIELKSISNMAKKKATTTTKTQKTKTALIREALKSTQDGSPSLVAKKLNAQGIKVTPQYVSTIKAADKRKSLLGTPNRRPGRPVGSGTKNSLRPIDDLSQASELMLKAVELVLKAGGSEARQMITMAESMVDRINNGKN